MDLVGSTNKKGNTHRHTHTHTQINEYIAKGNWSQQQKSL